MFLKNKFGVGYHLSIVKTPACQPDKIDGNKMSIFDTVNSIILVKGHFMYTIHFCVKFAYKLVLQELSSPMFPHLLVAATLVLSWSML